MISCSMKRIIECSAVINGISPPTCMAGDADSDIGVLLRVNRFVGNIQARILSIGMGSRDDINFVL